ncbi:hypothetical protein FM114_09070 [Luteococcus japonicus LSP_Lj1]|uniref:Uncharacterized protein n=1 Tax=Luteococcus japonicus LSP_Lj1 TaxID=1255658 RepID=A0A1R4JRJ0_9ACTN|nr:hypothetical protein FM114_09070 [Luteococcus japonicus LSP_Lj1]
MRGVVRHGDAVHQAFTHAPSVDPGNLPSCRVFVSHDGRLNPMD